MQSSRFPSLWLPALLTLGFFLGLLLSGADRAQAHGLAVWAEVLEDGRTVRIEAFYSNGRAVPGARVEVDRAGDGKEEAAERLAEGETDAEGRFELEIETPTALVIRVRAGGHHHGKAEIELEDFEEATTTKEFDEGPS